jgi:hypothetical protein
MSFENVAQFRSVTNEYYIHEEFKNRLDSRNVCYYYLQCLLSSLLASKNLKIKLHKTVIVTDFLYWFKTWPLIREEMHRLRVTENRF